jgi:hypothetical protein
MSYLRLISKDIEETPELAEGFTYFGNHYGFRTLNHTIRANPIVPTTTEDQAMICIVMISGAKS